MIIRRAVDTPGEREQLERLALHFSLVEPYRALFNATGRRGIIRMIDRLFALGDQAAIFVCDDKGAGVMIDGALAGGIALLEVEHPMTMEIYAEELCWWVEPNRRGMRLGPQLIVAAEDWATSRGLRSIKMVAPIPSQVGRYYERRNYQAIETAYLKVL